MDNIMDIMNQKLVEYVTGDDAQGSWDLPADSWMTLESYSKRHTYKYH